MLLESIVLGSTFSSLYLLNEYRKYLIIKNKIEKCLIKTYGDIFDVKLKNKVGDNYGST